MTPRSIILIAIAVAIIVLKSKAKKKGLPNHKVLAFFTAMFAHILVFGLIATAILFPGFEKLETTGPYEIQTEILELTDPTRSNIFHPVEGERSLSTALYYPLGNAVEKGTAPLVVFSHGGLGGKISNISLYEELASHGYFVVAIDHTGHAFVTKLKGKNVYIDRGYMDEILREHPDRDPVESETLYKKWMKLRTDDIGFVIDYFKESAKSGAAAHSMIDPEKIAVTGHSLGGSAALGMPRIRDDIDAVIALESPFMVDITGVENGKFTWNETEYPVPMLNIYSDNVWKILDTDMRYAQNKRYLRNDEKIAYYYVEGSSHYTLTDLSLVSPMLVKLIGGPYELPPREGLLKINELSVKFLAEHLR